jgi:hypothetical protein
LSVSRRTMKLRLSLTKRRDPLPPLRRGIFVPTRPWAASSSRRFVAPLAAYTKKEPCGGGPTAPVQLLQQVSGAISHRYFQKLKATDLRHVTRRYESKVKLMFYFETSLVRISGMTANNLAWIFVQLKRASHAMEDFGTNIGCLVLLPITIRESMSVRLETKVITALIGVLIVLTQTPASAQYLDSDGGLGGTNCGFLTLQQCRATEILRAGLMLQSARVYAAQPQLTAPSLNRVFAGGSLSYGGSNVALRLEGNK